MMEITINLDTITKEEIVIINRILAKVSRDIDEREHRHSAMRKHTECLFKDLTIANGIINK